jgi:hypothetical protein
MKATIKLPDGQLLTGELVEKEAEKKEWKRGQEVWYFGLL